MTVLADTSVWLKHLRHGNPRLARLLEGDRIVVQPWVVRELALGALPRRSQLLGDLRSLATAPVADHDEVVALVERVPLWGRGIGWVDAHLLASALLDRLRL